MNHKEFEDFVDQFVAELASTLKQANAEYANGGDQEFKDSAFANFETTAKELELTREQVNRVFHAKHVLAIQGWLNGIEQKRESIRGRMIDKVAYDVILFAMQLSARKFKDARDKWKTDIQNVTGISSGVENLT